MLDRKGKSLFTLGMVQVEYLALVYMGIAVKHCLLNLNMQTQNAVLTCIACNGSALPLGLTVFIEMRRKARQMQPLNWHPYCTIEIHMSTACK